MTSAKTLSGPEIFFFKILKLHKLYSSFDDAFNFQFNEINLSKGYVSYVELKNNSQKFVHFLKVWVKMGNWFYNSSFSPDGAFIDAVPWDSAIINGKGRYFNKKTS